MVLGAINPRPGRMKARPIRDHLVLNRFRLNGSRRDSFNNN
jgi:hypothetical protein